jgi:hypothetical protein
MNTSPTTIQQQIKNTLSPRIHNGGSNVYSTITIHIWNQIIFSIKNPIQNSLLTTFTYKSLGDFIPCNYTILKKLQS